MDLLIQNATLIDGVDGIYRANVAVDGGILAVIDRNCAPVTADRVLDGTGLVLTPGFIDIHRHADLKPYNGERWFELSQGITSMVSGNCGFSVFPSFADHFDAAAKYALPILGRVPESLREISPRSFFEKTAGLKMETNCGYLVGNGSLRRAVCGFENREPTPAEKDKILDLLDQSLASGALGLSMGIMYTPECFQSMEELTDCAKVAARHHKPVIAHIRGEGGTVLESIDEMISICRASGASVHISHMKAAGTDMWGRAVPQMLERIDRARQEGLDVTFDAYPYTAGSTTLLSLLPPEFLAGGTDGVLKAIRTSRKEILRAFNTPRRDWDNYVLTLGWGRVMVSDSSDSGEIGRTIEELAAEAGRDPGEFALDLLEREDGSVPIVLEEMDPADVRQILTRPDCIVISDSLYSATGKPHPRKYGAFQRFIRQYALDSDLLSLQEAVRRITDLPAAFLQLKDRGRLLEGYAADLVLMDPDRLRDRATYTEPERESEGIRAVIVNGKIAFENGDLTGAAAGRLL